MTTLVLAEHDNSTLHEATRHAVTAALKIGEPVTVLVAGHKAQAVAQAAAAISGVSKVSHADGPAYADFGAENIAALLAFMMTDHNTVVAAATSRGKDILPRVAGLRKVPVISDVIEVTGPRTFVRPINAGAFNQEVESSSKKNVVTVRPTAFKAAPISDAMAPVVPHSALSDLGFSRFVKAEITKSERPELTGAKIVVSGGRAMGSAEEFTQVIEGLADRLGGGVGASRAAVDAGYAPNDCQVGQTGKVVAPDLYIAIGISGAIQHLAGMKDSKIIVAINKDADAPIFQIADFGLVADYKAAIPEFIAALPKPKTPAPA